MIKQDIYLNRAGWHIVVYHSVDSIWADEILDDLIRIGCSGDHLKEAKRVLWSGAVNMGITFSNCSTRETVMVIGKTSNAGEYWNSIDHEKQHLLQDISETEGIDPFGEQISYISGDFMREVFRKAKHLLCDCCRKRLS